MYRLVLISLTFGLSNAIVCLPTFCENAVQPVLDCKGGIIEHAGFCGCYNICAKIEGESCVLNMPFRGVPNTEICDQGLECVPDVTDGVSFGHKCVKKTDNVSQRALSHCVTACQRKSLMCTISMIVYQGQWFAKCDQEGNFLPEQCDNT
ncbi:uncharacterized protein LOC131954470, partial [Physella acuta]|uniref:uncharacterized protein LOC131954470 n=1 Tax=Physella acuta TaxID=109671 RepID=UPI0027DE6B49